MSDDSDVDDPIDNIDFSVISTAIEAGGKTLDQILNAVHYGTPEVRYLLRESCDFIFECKYCKNLFRAIPNFIAHKRIYCGEKSFFPRTAPKKKSQKKEEVVIVRPVSPSLSAPVDTNGEKTVLEQILTGSFEGNSEAYKHYTEAAENVEKQKMNTPSVVVMTTPIEHTDIAVNIGMVDVSDSCSNETVSNASKILANAKKSQKQPLTKIVDGLKKSVQSSKSSTPTSSPKKLTDKKASPNSVNKDSENITVTPGTTSSLKNNNKVQPKAENNSVQKLKDKVLTSEQKTGNTNVMSMIEKSAKVVLMPLTLISLKSSSTPSAMEVSMPQKSISSVNESIASSTTKVAEKFKQESKSTSSNDLRPVKSQDGSELSELSQLGHCDLDQLKCLICNLQYSQKKTLLQHMHVIHSGSKKKYPCNMCHKTFDYFWGLTRHLLLNHKKTKEQIDRMRTELRALAYTVSEQENTDNEESVNQNTPLDKNGSSSRASRMRQYPKALVKMNTCNGCSKSFWKRSNYEEHVKQCGFLSTISTSLKEKKQNDTKQKNEEASSKESTASRRQRVLKKLEEGRKIKNQSVKEEDSPDTHSEKSGHSSSLEARRLKIDGKFEPKEVERGRRASGQFVESKKNESSKTPLSMTGNKRLRIDGKFIPKNLELLLLEKEIKQEESDKVKDGEGKKGNEMRQSKADAVKNKVVKKLKEKSRSFVPAQRFISTRRSAAFYHVPAQRTRFHEKRRAVVESKKKDARSPSKATVNESPDKKSPQQKSELELARRNLSNAIEKVKSSDRDDNPEKSASTRKKGTAAPSENSKLIGTSSAKKGTDNIQSSKENSHTNITPEVGRSRSEVRRTQKTSSHESSGEGLRCSVRKTDTRTSSRDTSVESLGSRQSLRSHRDSSRELSVESTTRSRQINAEKIGIKDVNNKDVERSRSLTRSTRSNLNESRDSSKESIKAHSSENIAEMKFSNSRHIPRHSESQVSEKREEGTGKKASPESEKKTMRGKPLRSNLDNKVEKENDKDRAKLMVTSDIGKDEIDGTRSRGQTIDRTRLRGQTIDGTRSRGQTIEKTKPKWSSKDWNTEVIEPKENKSDLTQTVKASELNNKKQGGTKVTLIKEKLLKDKEQLKGVTKHTILKTRARYSTRSMKTRVQAAKKMGELKKRFSTRISHLKKEKEAVHVEKETKSLRETVKSTKSPPTPGKNTKQLKSDTRERKVSTGKITRRDEGTDKQPQHKAESYKKVDAAQQVIVDKGDVDETKTTTYSHRQQHPSDKITRKVEVTDKRPQHKAEAYKKVDAAQQVIVDKGDVKETETHRQRHPSDKVWVKSIEEIWVTKEPGKPLQSVKCKKTIIESPKKLKSSRMYVVDPVKMEKPKCMDFSRINHLVDYSNNKCLQCGIEFPHISNLRRHAVRHLGWKRYKCKLCAYTGFNRSECNSHIKRRHAEKLISSSASLSSFIIDLNKKASKVRNMKKQSTLQEKKLRIKKSETAAESNHGNKRKSSTQTKVTSPKQGNTKSEIVESEIKEKTCTVQEFDSTTQHEISEEAIEELQVGRKSGSNSGRSSFTVVSARNVDSEEEVIFLRKRKRTLSREEEIVYKLEDDDVTEKTHLEMESTLIGTQPENLMESKADNDDELEDDIGSVSDYDENDGETPSRNVVSPTWTKMNPNVALMMATLEEARATKFSRGKKGRGGIRRFSSPLKKHPRLSTEEPSGEQDDEDQDEELIRETRDEVQETKLKGKNSNSTEEANAEMSEKINNQESEIAASLIKEVQDCGNDNTKNRENNKAEISATEATVQLSISENVNVQKNKETKKTLVQIEKDNHDNVIVIDDDNEDKPCETDYSAMVLEKNVEKLTPNMKEIGCQT